MRAGTVLLAGVACVSVGMPLAFIGILAPPLFPVATWVILLGLVACGAAGVVGLVSASGEDGREHG
ncbi:MAG TPA: hypothetical protein VFU06_14950 [Longimicrobiales bacterium]|nr:hypothetical protein [Longimicrobiales bacterium]